MFVEVKMPQFSDTMSEGKIINWLKKEGDIVKRGDAIAEVETDKASLEIEAFTEGILQKILIPIGCSVGVGVAIAILDNEAGSEEVDGSIAEKELRVSPLARSISQIEGVNLHSIKGTGDGGRILRRDVEGFIAKSREGCVCCSGDSSSDSKSSNVCVEDTVTMFDVAKISGEGSFAAPYAVGDFLYAPYIHVTSKVLVDDLVRIYSSLSGLARYDGITCEHLILKAISIAVRKVPRINCSYSDAKLVWHDSLDIAIVTPVEGSLCLPVLSNAQDLDLADLVEKTRALTNRARSGTLKSSDLTCGTLSVFNMGTGEIDQFFGVVYKDHGVAISVSSAHQEVVVKNGILAIGLVMRFSISADHRVANALVCSEFIKELKRAIEEPTLLLVS